MKKTYMMLIVAAVAISGSVLAKEKELDIASNTSGLSAETTASITKTAVAMGVKEPLNISKSGNDAKVAGSGSTVCTIKLAGETIQGVSCK